MNTGGPTSSSKFLSGSETKSVRLGWSCKSGPPGKLGNVPANAFQFEIDQLRNVSARLDVLADEHPIVGEEIVSISGNILSNAVLLEVLLATRMRPS
jgi:hypothetical protein